MPRLHLRNIAAASIVALFCLSACNQPQSKSTKTASSGQVTAHSGKAAVGGAFTLVDQTGKTVTDKDFLGKAQLIYFGFTFCPDVCPTALQQMGAALDMAGNAVASQYQPIFITVDYERDTPEQLAQYVTANGFPKNLIGLTGTKQQIDVAKKAFKAIGQKVDDPDTPGSYTYDHSSLIYMMDKNGEFLDVFTHTDTPAQIAERLKAHIKTGH